MKKFVSPWNVSMLFILVGIIILNVLTRNIAFFDELDRITELIIFGVILGIPSVGFLIYTERRYKNDVKTAMLIDNPQERLHRVEELLDSYTVNYSDEWLMPGLIEPKSRLVKERVAFLLSQGQFQAAMNNLDWIASMTARMKALNTESPTIDLREECDALAVICLSSLGEVFNAERKLESLLVRLSVLNNHGCEIIKKAQDALESAKAGEGDAQ